MEGKRKTRTSTAVKARYNKKTYMEIRASVPKELGEAFKRKCIESGKSQAHIIKRALEDFIAE